MLCVPAPRYVAWNSALVRSAKRFIAKAVPARAGAGIVRVRPLTVGCPRIRGTSDRPCRATATLVVPRSHLRLRLRHCHAAHRIVLIFGRRGSRCRRCEAEEEDGQGQHDDAAEDDACHSHVSPETCDAKDRIELVRAMYEATSVVCERLELLWFGRWMCWEGQCPVGFYGSGHEVVVGRHMTVDGRGHVAASCEPVIRCT